MMKDILPTQKISYFCSCDFLLAEMYRCSSGGKKPSRRHWSTEEINRVNSLTPGGWLKDSCCLKPWAARDDGPVTRWAAELCVCSTDLAALHRPGAAGRQGSGKVLLWCSAETPVERIRHEAYQTHVRGASAKFTAALDDFLHCFRWHFKQVIQCANKHTTKTTWVGTIGLS